MNRSTDDGPRPAEIQRIVFAAIDDLNQDLDPDQALEKGDDTLLLSRSGKIDSLGFVRLIVSIEQLLEEEFGLALTLADEKAFSQKVSPFRTVGSLIVYISLVLEEHAHG